VSDCTVSDCTVWDRTVYRLVGLWPPDKHPENEPASGTMDGAADDRGRRALCQGYVSNHAKSDEDRAEGVTTLASNAMFTHRE
jgi:hypothetical protein